MKIIDEDQPLPQETAEEPDTAGADLHSISHALDGEFDPFKMNMHKLIKIGLNLGWKHYQLLINKYYSS